MKQTIRKALALFMTIALVATTITFTAGNTLQAEEQAPPEVSQETSEPAKADAPATTPEPEKSEPVKETQTMNISQDEPDDEDYEPAPADNEKKNPANEKKDNDKDKEKKKFHDSKADLDVSVTAPAEAFPEGTSIKLTETDFNSIKRLIQNHYGSDVEVAGVQAVDISFVKSNGKSTKPSKNVDVTISGIDISGENMALFHISGNRAEYVKEVSGTSVSFSAGSFSPYAIASYGEKDSYKDDDTQNRAVEVYVNTTTTLTGGEGYNHKWKIKDSDKSVARINSTNKNIAIVKGVSEGSVTITHEYKRNGKERTETFTVTVLKKQVIQATDGEITGAEKVEKYKTISLNLTLKPEGAEAASCIWYSSDDSILTVDNSGKVTGVSEGTATVTAQVTSSDGKTFKVTKRITVTEATGTNSAMFFYLKTPTSDPASNSTDQWGDNIGNGTISTSNLQFDGINAWVASDPGRVISWPAGFEGGNVPRGSNDWSTIYGAFKGTVGNVDEADVEAIILHPYKISNNNDGYHVDCTVELRVKNIYTATYYLWDAGGTGYIWKWAENVRDGKATSPNNAPEAAGIKNLPATKTVDGRTYRLITWHDNEGLNGNAVTFPYTMTANTNFYAKYIADYIVSYDLNGGTVDGASGSIPNVTKSEGDTVSVSSIVPKKDGYNFIGWQYGDAVYEGDETFTMPASDVKLTALWEEQYEVVIAADSDTKTYNGKNQLIETFKVNGSDSTSDFTTFKYKGEEYTVVAKASGTGKDVGDYGVNITSYTIKKGSVDVTAMFNVSTLPGMLTITPATLTVTTPDDSKVYDGDSLTAAGSITGFVNGETAKFTTTGSQKEVGSSNNTYEIDWEDEDTTALRNNYTISENIGTLEVTEYAGEITVTTTGGTFTYDGEAHGATVSVSELPKGYTLETATSNDTATHVAEGTVTANCDTLVIKNAQGVDVTSRLNIKRVDGSITITPATLTVTTPSDSKVYDGDPFTAAGSITGFVKEETATFATTGTQTEVGNSKNTYSITWNKTAVESDYTINETIGTLTVTENADEIVVTTTGGTFTYDGKPHKATVTVSTLPKGYTLETATSDDTATHVAEGTVTANCDTLVIKNAQRVDVTSKLNITYVDGSIKINPATLTVTTPDASKVYDGDPLTAEGSIEGFVNGEIATFETTGTQTEVDSSKNTYKITWDDTAAESDYTVNESIGTLTVTEYAGEIVVTTTGGEFTYNGEAHGATVSVSTLPKGYTLETATSDDTATHVADGTVTANCDTLVIKNAKGEDVTSKLNIRYVDGSIKINPATLIVTTPSATKAYDGDPLTAEGSIEGFVNGETVTFETTGTQTEVDSSKNTYEITWDGTAAESDYTISADIGTLTVTAATGEIIVSAGSYEGVYDGQEHGVTVAVSGLPSGYTAEASASMSAKDVTDTSITTSCDSLVIKNAKGNVISDEEFNNLNIKYVNGSINITPKHVSVVTQGGSKTYDGTPLEVKGEDAVTVTGIVDGETYGAAATGSQTEVGSSSNTYKLLFGNDANTFTAKASNYDVEWNLVDGYKAKEESLGRLEVTEYAGEIVVTTTGGTFIYDGEAHGATVSVSTLPTGYTLETATSNDTATHVAEGTVTANCDTLVIKNAQGVDVTSRLNIKRVDGSITITPATLTVTTPSDSKVYDGDPFTAAGSITGFVKEETATFATTGTQTEVGNSKNTYSITWNKTAVESDYTINETIGTLTVTENADEIVVTTTGGTFTYDGKPHKATVTVSTLPKGYTLETATSDDTATHVAEGTVTANCDTLVIKNAQRVDVTSKLNITYVDGSIKINPATLTITTPDASKVYDGTPLTAAGSITGFVNGETAKFTTTGSQTTSGSRKNTYKIDWEHEATTASESNYTISESVGTLTVSEYAGLITVTTTGGTFTYDGEAHGATVEVTGLPEKGYTVETATSNDKATHVADGTVEADCDTLVIRNAQGDDVTDKLNIEHVNGNITINPATLTVITQSASKVYDSKPLTAGGSIKGFVEGENAKFTVTGSQTAKGSSKNTYEIEWDDENTRASDYLISEQIGTLTVTENADEIVVTTTGGTFTYDGKVHRAKVSVSKLPKGYTLVEAESTARAKNVTEEPIAATADVLKIVNADGLDVTKELKIKYVDDVIRVNPRSITVTSASATKQYDGTPLTANSFVIGGDGMAEGESLVVLFGDGQTEIGKKENDFQILGVTETSNLKAASQLEAEDVSRPELDNYDITTVFGTLTVTAEANLPAAVDNGDNGENGGNGGNGNNGGTANPDGLVAGDGYNVTTIGNGQTPLANSLLDLNCCILHLLIMLAAMLMLIWYTHDMKKRQRKIFNLEEQLQELE